MDSAGLRAVQEPLKDAYRSNPREALVTLRARGELDEQAVTCSVATGRELAVAGLHPATGGDGSLLCSGDMLLEALVACAGVTLRAVATSLGISVASGRVRAEGDLDFRGTLGLTAMRPWASQRSASLWSSRPTPRRRSSLRSASSPSATASSTRPSLPPPLSPRPSRPRSPSGPERAVLAGSARRARHATRA